MDEEVVLMGDRDMLELSLIELGKPLDRERTQVWVVDGQKLSLETQNLAVLGSFGVHVMEHMPEMEAETSRDGVLDKSNYRWLVWSPAQMREFGVDEVEGKVVCVLVNLDNGKYKVVRVPVIEVARAMPEIVDEVRFVETLNSLQSLGRRTDNESRMRFGRKIFGVWEFAASHGRLAEVNQTMEELFAIPGVVLAEDIGVVNDFLKKWTDSSDSGKDIWTSKVVADTLAKIVRGWGPDSGEKMRVLCEAVSRLSEKFIGSGEMFWAIMEPVVGEVNARGIQTETFRLMVTEERGLFV